MKELKQIVILGGGYAGVNAANVLYKKLKSHRDIEITLIDKNPYHTLMTELHEVAGGRAEPESVLVSYQKIFGGKNIRLITDRIQTIDFKAKKLISGSMIYDYDYLIIGAGAEPDYLNVPGAREYSLPLWSFENAITIRHHIERMFHLAAKEANPEKRKELLTFVIVGGGFTGIEMAGELLEWRTALCRVQHLDPKDVRVVIVEALPTILSVLPERLVKKAANYFVKKGGEILVDSPITGITPAYVTIKDGSTLAARTVIWTCGVQGCEFGANLALKKGKSVIRNYPAQPAVEQDTNLQQYAEGGKYVYGKLGRLDVNEFMEAPEHPGVYVAGDLAWCFDNGKPAPQIVETALQTSETVAHNILAGLKGTKKKSFKPEYHGLMVSVGGKYAVADVMNIRLAGFMAMAMKHLINLHYLLGIAGVNACWEYIKHHFLDVKENRSLIGGHAAGKVRSYWVVALRLFLGVMWLVEGTTKVLDGWLDPNHINILHTNTTAVVSVAEPGQKKADAETSATAATMKEDGDKLQSQAEAVTGATSENEGPKQGGEDAVTSATSANESDKQASADAVTSATQASAPQAQKPLIDKPLGIYLWFEANFIAKAPFVFQATVVIAEILIGLALLGGLFTFLASAGSIGLCLMFIMSAMASKEIFWFMISAIVLMGGAGRSFGLDYWVMPWLQKWWNSTKLAKRTYLYFDEPRK